jgi:FixJ family two-component response regulator
MIVLIDDDHLIQLGWKFAAKQAGLTISCFSSIELFCKEHEKFPLSSIIYVDSNLGENIKGEVESKKIFELGFSQIYITTGYSPDDISAGRIPWIKGVISKDPPFLRATPNK